jgi:hypothetical protein
MLRALVVVVAVAGALAGCGDDEPIAGSSPTPAPTAAATETPTPTPETTETPTPTATEQPAPEEQEGGAGDEEEARVPVHFTVNGGVKPPEVGVPAFLALELIVTNETSSPVTAQLEGEEPLVADAGQTVRRRIEGRRPGRYPVGFGDAGEAVLVTGVDVGP